MSVAPCRRLAAVVAAVIALGAAQSIAADVADVNFAHDVRPILSDKCFLCHGPDEASRQADLRLDTREGVEYAFAGGDPDASEAWRRIHSNDPDEVMPPPELKKPLSDQEIATLRRWLDAGAPWSRHWAFERVERPEVPDGEFKNPIDVFVQRRRAQRGLQANPEAPASTRLRRLSFDLTGLPPSVEELAEFESDPSPAAWGAAIDRLFASPHYGERMAVDWLDGARYADTNGYQNDFKRNMWPWRDWVIAAFNRNQPFDEFTIEQIAGDLLSDPTPRQRLATGFNRNNRTVTEAGSLPEEWLVEYVVDRVETTGAVFLGLTLGCARCHDHKFDPVSQREFYQFYDFFHHVDEKGVVTETRGNVPPIMRVMPEDQRPRMKELHAAVASAKESVDSKRSLAEAAATQWAREIATQPIPAARPPTAHVALGDTLAAVGSEGGEIEPLDGTGSKPVEMTSPVGPARRFGGKSWLEYPGMVTPSADSLMTISAWIKRQKNGAVWSMMDDSNSFRGFDALLDGEGRLMVHLISDWPSDAIKVTTKDPLPKDEWVLLAVSYDGSRKAAGVEITVNGRPQRHEVNNDNLEGDIDSDLPFTVGRRSSSNFVGGIARVRIHDAALSSDELRSLALADLVEARKGSGATAEGASQEGYADYYLDFAPDPAATAYRTATRSLAEAESELAKFEASFPTVMIMDERGTPRDTFVLRRGEYDKADKDRQVTAGIPEFLGGLPNDWERSDGRFDRLALAKWLVSRDNPLTSRVTVNRLWARFFGTGLVATAEDFGLQGDAPSHPELLDWLAVELMDSGWDLQHVMRLIVTSETYQQSSGATPQDVAADPDNRWLARGPRRRLKAEFVRDSALEISGLLSEKIGGPPVFPYQPEGLWAELAGGAGQGPYEQSTGEDLYRRSLYTFRKRTVPHPTMSTFDAPSFETCTVRRETTNTPLQALALLNDTTYVEAARALGERMMTEGGDSTSDRLAFGFRLATSRRPSSEELVVLDRALARYLRANREAPDITKGLLETGAGSTPALPRDELGAYATVGALLLNLDETITVE